MSLPLKPWAFARLLATAVFFFSLVGCTTQLAPGYDRNLADGLNAANAETMTLMATASAGVAQNTFASREEKYNALIGRLDALTLLAGARPMPRNKVTEVINKVLEKRGVQPLDDREDDPVPPSTHAIKKLAETLAKMRDTDRKQGVTAYEVQAFKSQAAIYLDQAITYENFLQR